MEKTGDVKRVATMLDVLAILMKCMTREERNEMLASHRQELLPKQDMERYEELRTNELFHIKHVRACYNSLLPDLPPSDHDHTKDEFYFFITIVGFTFQLKDQMPQELWQGELNRHFKNEPHHPEYEKLNQDTGLRLADNNIAEMVIDRLSRNLQFNDGKYNEEQLAIYEPTFIYDQDSRIKLYREFLKQYKPVVQQIWKDLKLNL